MNPYRHLLCPSQGERLLLQGGRALVDYSIYLD